MLLLVFSLAFLPSRVDERLGWIAGERSGSLVCSIVCSVLSVLSDCFAEWDEFLECNESEIYLV